MWKLLVSKKCAYIEGHLPSHPVISILAIQPASPLHLARAPWRMLSGGIVGGVGGSEAEARVIMIIIGAMRRCGGGGDLRHGSTCAPFEGD